MQNIYPFLIGQKPADNSSQLATVDQIWKKFAICEKWGQFYSIIVRKLDS